MPHSHGKTLRVVPLYREHLNHPCCMVQTWKAFQFNAVVRVEGAACLGGHSVTVEFESNPKRCFFKNTSQPPHHLTHASFSECTNTDSCCQEVLKCKAKSRPRPSGQANCENHFKSKLFK